MSTFTSSSPRGADAEDFEEIQTWVQSKITPSGGGAGSAAGAPSGAGSGSGGPGDAISLTTSQLFGRANLTAVCQPSAVLGAYDNGFTRRAIIAGSGDVLGLVKNQAHRDAILSSFVESTAGVRAFVGHLSEITRNPPVDQDAFRIEALANGNLRVIVADGAGCSKLYAFSASHVTSDCVCGGGAAGCRFTDGGSGVAKASVASIVAGLSLREGSDRLRDHWFEKYSNIMDQVYQFEHTDDRFFPAAQDEVFAHLYGGQSMVSCLELDFQNSQIRYAAVGDTGAIGLRSADRYEVIGSSEHTNLGGESNSKYVFGGELGSLCTVSSQSLSFTDCDYDFIIVACDGFWDAFKSGKPSNYPGFVVQPLPVEAVYTAITQAIQAVSNPGQALAQLARSKNSKDDITVAVIDMRPLRLYRAHSGEAYPATESVAGAGAGSPAGAGAGSGSGGPGDTLTPVGEHNYISDVIADLPVVELASGFTDSDVLFNVPGDTAAVVQGFKSTMFAVRGMSLYAGYVFNTKVKPDNTFGQDVIAAQAISDGVRIVVCDGSGEKSVDAYEGHYFEECDCGDEFECGAFPNCGVEVAKYACDCALKGLNLRDAHDELVRLMPDNQEKRYRYQQGQATVAALDIIGDPSSRSWRYTSTTIGDSGGCAFSADGSVQPLTPRSTHPFFSGKAELPGAKQECFGPMGSDYSEACTVNSDSGYCDKDFVVFASDGFWDFFQKVSGKYVTHRLPAIPIYASDVVRTVTEAISQRKNPGQALAQLAKKCGSRDDIGIIVIDLRQLGSSSTV